MKDINTDQEITYPKKNVALEAIFNILICFLGIETIENLSRKANKPISENDPKFLVPAVLASGALVTYRIVKDRKYNQEVDRLTKQQASDFTNRIKQEQVAKDTTSSMPAKSI